MTMRCEQAHECMTAKMEGEATPQDFEHHVDQCPACRRLLGELGSVKALLRGLPREEMPSQLRAQIGSALAALPAPESDDLGCETTQEWLSEHLEDALLPQETRRLESHLEHCAACRRALSDLKALAGLLASVPPEPLPLDLAGRIHAALAALPEEKSVQLPLLAVPPLRAKRPWRLHWQSALAGGAVAAAALGFAFWSSQSLHVPTIETAAVTVKQDVAVNIGFDVASNVDDVTFQIDLPDGLKFVDDHSQPLEAQSVSWRGSLKAGKTVVPIMVRGVRPGSYAIEAYVRKGAMTRKTTILLPVTAG